jgi:hypothetical protein
VFEEISGLPLHPLAVHGAVVLVPLLVLASLGYALVPRFRARVGWVAVLLSVVAPAAAAVSKLSGDAFQRRLGLPLAGQLADHHDYGTVTMWVTIALGVLTLLLVWFRGRAGQETGWGWLTATLTGLVVLAAGAAAVFVVLAGDLGSRIVWEPIWTQVTG